MASKATAKKDALKGSINIWAASTADEIKSTPNKVLLKGIKTQWDRSSLSTLHSAITTAVPLMEVAAETREKEIAEKLKASKGMGYVSKYNHYKDNVRVLKEFEKNLQLILNAWYAQPSAVVDVNEDYDDFSI